MSLRWTPPDDRATRKVPSDETLHRGLDGVKQFVVDPAGNHSAQIIGLHGLVATTNLEFLIWRVWRKTGHAPTTRRDKAVDVQSDVSMDDGRE